MSLLSILGKIGGVAAAPFTGGASLIPTILSGIGDVASVAGKASQGRAEGRAAEAQLAAERDRIAAQNYATQQQAALQARQQGLNERQFALNAPSTRLSQLLRGDILQNVQDRHTTVPGITTAESTGGIRPSMLSADARSGGGEMVKKALEGLMTGDQFDPMTLLQPPGLTPTPQSGGLDSFLNILGGVGSAAGAVAPLLGQRKPPVTPGLSPAQLYGQRGGFGGVKF